MKKWMKRLLYAIAVVVIAGILFFAFAYFRIDNRVDITASVPEFENVKPIERLDSIVIEADSMTAYLSKLTEQNNVHGLGISIINNHRLVYQRYFGWRNKQAGERFSPGSIWYGASLSKTIFADVVLQLVEEGLLDLDTPLYTYLKEPLYSYSTNTVQQLFGKNSIDYSSLKADERYKKITPRMCLAHTTGLPNWAWLEPDKKLKINFEPGTRYSYSGEGMFLLQFVIEKLTGRDFEELAYEKVLAPQQMNRSSFVWQRAYENNYVVGHNADGNNLRIPKRNVPNAAGSLSTTLEEYTNYFLTVLAQEEPRYKTLITLQTEIKSRQQFGPEALIDTNDNDDIGLSYGLGFGLYDTPFGKVFFKEGHLDGWQHYAVGFPEKGTALIIMSNSDNAESTFKEIIEYTTGNTYTPWFWEGYIPHSQK
jgi:CubicO group peptidase (beta-lactamase class C family)